jgi:PAS domain S-box-containing protein
MTKTLKSSMDEIVCCKEYNEDHFHRLENKIMELEKAGRIFEQKMVEHERTTEQIIRLNSLKAKLLDTISLEEKLKLVTDTIIGVFDADFARIWLTKEGDLCDRGCIHAVKKEGAEGCPNRNRCLHLIVSSGRYTHIDGDHRRVPLGCYKIGRVASGEDSGFITNVVTEDPRVHDNEWAKTLGLVSFAGYRLISPDGLPIGVLAFFKKQAIPLTEEVLLEDLAGFTSHVILSEMRRQALRESEAKFRALFESANDAILLLNKDYFIDCNPKTLTMFDCSMEQIVGQTPYRFSPEVQPDGRKSMEKAQEKIKAAINGEAQFFEWKHCRYDGTLFDTEISLSAFSAAGKCYLQAIIRDITGRKEAEEKIRELNRELEQRIEEIKAFSYSVSHDLRAPLIVIEGFSRRLLEKYSSRLDKKGQKYVKTINTNSRQIAEFMRDLLDFMISGNKKIEITHIEVKKIVNELFQQLLSLNQHRIIELNIKSLPDAKGDKIMIRNILSNLLNNAVKYSRARDIAIVEVAGWVEGEKNVYYVKDNGVGFSMDQTDRLFKVFERLHPVEEFEGTGLGLAIVKRIVQQHGGEVWAEGRVDEGATFYFSIPGQGFKE